MDQFTVSFCIHPAEVTPPPAPLPQLFWGISQGGVGEGIFHVWVLWRTVLDTFCDNPPPPFGKKKSLSRTYPHFKYSSSFLTRSIPYFSRRFFVSISYVVEQLRCLGVLRTCEVLKIGMPTRIAYGDLKQSLGDGIMEAERMFEGEPEKSLVAAILWAFDVSYVSRV